MRRWMTRFRRAILLGCLFCVVAFWSRSFNRVDWVSWSRSDPRRREVQEYYISSTWRGIVQFGRSFHSFRCQHDYEAYDAIVRGLHAEIVVTAHDNPGLRSAWRHFSFAMGWHYYPFPTGVPCGAAGGGWELLLPHWSVVLFLLIGLYPEMFAALRELRRRRRIRAGLCPGCGYDVRLLRDRCPECGERIAPSPPAAVIP